MFELALRPAELARFREATRLVLALPTQDPRRTLNLSCAPDRLLAWVRANVNFYERLLNLALPPKRGQPPIQVPYWPWDNIYAETARTVPAIYAAPSQPLFVKRRPFTVAIDVEPCLALRRVEDLGGAAFTGPFSEVCSAAGLSASDPLIYAHLANVDRMWSSWEALGQGRIMARGLDAERAEYSAPMKPLRLGENGLTGVAVVRSRVERVPEGFSFLLLRGARVAALGKATRFGLYCGENLLGTFSTGGERDRPEGWTVAVRAARLEAREMLRVRALDGDGEMLLAARDVLVY